MDWTSCLVASGGVQNVATINCIPIILTNVINAALLLGGIVAVIFIVYAGIKYVASGGDSKQVQSAQQTLTYAIIGLVLILLSFFIVNLISYLTGVDCIRLFGFGQCNVNPRPPLP